jgi:hypothetical protein
MTLSERFLNSLGRLKRAHDGEGLDVTVEAVRSQFDQVMAGLPEGMIEEIYLNFLDSFGKSGQPESAFVEYSEKLGLYVDLFHQEIDERSFTATPEELGFIRDLVNSYADRLDMGMITSIMSLLVEKGAFE